ncbi:acetylxylan esterase [Streptomyces sp. NPDC087422]|uniref:acetylxylan esterase n=1 Tax=Streptomyces sp. NPDC087422 TaxID=3365786 RepID=UPI003802E54A
MTAEAIETHDFPFDPTYGYDLDRLLQVGTPEAPADFGDFWQGAYAKALAVDTAPRVGALEEERDGVRVHAVSYTSVGGFRVGGWLTLPADGHVTHGMVVLHGYGGRDAVDVTLPPPGTAAIWPCARGMATRSLDPEIPATAAEHVVHGIASRETYVHGGCVADTWCAASALLALVPGAARQLALVGGSFGGGIGALALPWDDRFHHGLLTVPSFGNHPLRLTLPCTGSGEAVRAHYTRHPEVTEVLGYFDAAVAATRVRVPVHVGAALFDPAVPPPGQFAVHNALGGPKELFVLTAGHVEYPAAAEEDARLRAAQREFLAEADPR